jgi:hypothetical protein
LFRNYKSTKKQKMHTDTHGRVVLTNLVVLPWLFAMMAIFFSPIAYGSGKSFGANRYYKKLVINKIYILKKFKVSKCYVSGGGPFPRACPGHYRYEYCVSAECTNGRRK